MAHLIPHTEKTKNKISKSLEKYFKINGSNRKGIKHSKKSIMLMSKSHSGKRSNKKDKTYEEIYGKIKAKKLRIKCGEKIKGKTYEEICGKMIGKKRREKQRINRINQIEKDGGILQKGTREKQILDEIEQKERISIDRQFRLLGYAPDGYCHKTNTIYEIYEPFHKNQIEKDLKRQKEIQKYLKCKFKIIWDNN